MQFTYKCKQDTTAMSGSALSRGSTCKFTTWEGEVSGTLGTFANCGHVSRPRSQDYMIVGRPELQACFVDENACRSPTLLMQASVVRSTILKDRILSSTDCAGSKGGLCNADKTKERSQEGTR